MSVLKEQIAVLRTATTLSVAILAPVILDIASMPMDMIVMVRIIINGISSYLPDATCIKPGLLLFPQILMSVQNSLTNVSKFVTTLLAHMCVTVALVMPSIVMDGHAEVKLMKLMFMITLTD